MKQITDIQIDLIRPFGGPPVPWETYISWLKLHGILFSPMLGIGQKLVPK